MAVAVEEDLSTTFAALSDPTRRAIVRRLASGEATVNELAEPFHLTQQAISKHVKVLKRCGLITQTVDGQRRPCRLQPERLGVAVDWLVEQRRLWEDRYDRLDAHLADLDGKDRR